MKLPIEFENELRSTIASTGYISAVIQMRQSKHCYRINPVAALNFLKSLPKVIRNKSNKSPK